ncbi:protein Asterix [Arctopsyche grandis]|uniref:protein Asterix n=1 Tax=Arctopsyche grandis TaxID=121162 RepID=UPI00406D7987
MLPNSVDPRRPERQQRYKPPTAVNLSNEDLTTDYMNILGMIFSMCGLMMRLKWCAWTALYCSCISYSNSRLSDDAKQILSSFMLSISAVAMSYLQNPQPMINPWGAGS